MYVSYRNRDEILALENGVEISAREKPPLEKPVLRRILHLPRNSTLWDVIDLDYFPSPMLSPRSTLSSHEAASAFSATTTRTFSTSRVPLHTIKSDLDLSSLTTRMDFANSRAGDKTGNKMARGSSRNLMAPACYTTPRKVSQKLKNTIGRPRGLPRLSISERLNGYKQRLKQVSY